MSANSNTNDLRTFIGQIEEMGQLRRLEGADWNVEIGAITECVGDKEGPALLFDGIKDYGKGLRILTNVFRTHERFALATGLPTDVHGIELLDIWRKRFKAFKPFATEKVKDGPVFEHVIKADDVDLGAFPAPKWHEDDGGRYIGTGCCVITVDPDDNTSNMGTYRCMVQGRDRISIKMNKGKHGRIMMEKYHAQGRACPIAVSLGHDPALFLASVLSLGTGVQEYEIAGALRGAPVQVVKSPMYGLPIPARAEIVLEGEIPPFTKGSLPKEGPFGEWPGYYADTTVGEVPLMIVKAIYRRDDPIILGMPPLKPPNHYMSLPLGAAALWDQLESAGIPNVTGVWSFIFGGVAGPVIVIAIKQAYLGHAKQTLVAASGARAGAYGGKFYVVVDEDVDITNLQDVIWAMATRCDPGEAIDIVRGIWTSPADPAIRPGKRAMAPGQTTLRHGYVMDRVLIDGCRPYAWLDEFPKVNSFPTALKRQMIAKWKI